jgi:uncharacterized protein
MKLSKNMMDKIEQFMAVNLTNQPSLRNGFGVSQRTISGSYDYADSLHDIYRDYGYPLELSFYNFWNMYRRGGIAGAIVEQRPNVCWVSPPIIKASDIFLNELQVLIKNKKLWKRLKSADKKQRVGQYGALFIRVKDGLSLDQPVGKLNGPGSIESIIPLYEGQLIPFDFYRDPKSADYGKPSMYQYRGGSVGDRNPNVSDTFNIHPSRVIIISENADDSIYGISSLERPYNSLLDLRKITGGSAEGFYRNASQSLVFSAKDDSQMITGQELLDEFDKNVQDFIENRMRKYLYAPGVETTQINSSLTSPKEHFFASLYDVSAADGTPATILIGQQTGRLASDEDQVYFNVLNQSRRENFLTECVEDAINWFIKNNVLPNEEFVVEWDDLLSVSDDQKAKIADILSGINEKQFRSGGEAVFSGTEIRAAAGYEQEIDEFPPSEYLDELELTD